MFDSRICDSTEVTAVVTCAIPDGADRMYRPFLEVTWSVEDALATGAYARVSRWQFYTLDPECGLPDGRVGIQERFAAQVEAALKPLAIERGSVLLAALGCQPVDAGKGASAIVC